MSTTARTGLPSNANIVNLCDIDMINPLKLIEPHTNSTRLGAWVSELTVVSFISGAVYTRTSCLRRSGAAAESAVSGWLDASPAL